MKFISNKGKTKQVKYTSGMLINIPEGLVSLPDDSNLDKLVGSSPDLSYITQDIFLKQLGLTSTKEKIETAKKEAPKPKAPKKKVVKKEGVVTKSEKISEEKLKES